MNKNQLKQFLNKNKIPLEKWGLGNSKTLSHLIEELKNGESVVEITSKGLVRKGKGVILNIYFQDSQNLLKLIEIEQRFKDGRIRKRNLETSVSEKMKPGESPEQAARRALSEELGILNSGKILEGIKFTTVDKKTVASESFPGLMTKRVTYIADIYLSEEFYKPEGYTERQPDKTTAFKWIKVD